MAQEFPKFASAMNPFGLAWPAFSSNPAASSGNPVTAWPEYMVDALQRSVLFLDLLRQRGNEEIEISSRPMATVLRFDHEELMSGRSLPRPINYSLLRILPSPGVAIDRRKRPVVVVDPREIPVTRPVFLWQLLRPRLGACARPIELCRAQGPGC